VGVRKKQHTLPPRGLATAEARIGDPVDRGGHPLAFSGWRSITGNPKLDQKEG
jgi:hypothetical protein